MKKLNVSIQGLSPLLMLAYKGETPSDFKNWKPEEKAEYAAYRDSKTKELFIPAQNLLRALISGGAYSKDKGRASLMKKVAACVQIEEPKLFLGTKTYEIDVQRGVIPATRGSVAIVRPKLEDWSTRFTVTFDENLITEDQMKQVIYDTGTLVGLLSFRPEKKGPYGRFEPKFS